MDIVNYNSQAWNRKVEDGAVYTNPVSKDIIERSKAGEWSITVTTEKAVPKEWFPSSLNGMKILCLASAGGQQGPVLAAAGAEVTVVDISEKQLEQDKAVANRDGLKLETVQADMCDLHVFEKETFDMIIHPVSNLFVENILPVWKEAARVLIDQGILISGFTNPLLFIFDDEQEMKGKLAVKNSIPSSTITELSESELQEHIDMHQTIEFGHTLEDQIQGQIDAGFSISGFYEDDFGGNRIIDRYIKTFMATKAVKTKL